MGRPVTLIAVVVLTFVSLNEGIHADASGGASITTLSTGRCVTRKIAGVSPQLFSVELAAGSFAEGLAQQNGVDVSVTTSGPSGRKIETFDSPNGTVGPEPFSIMASTRGRYVVAVAATDPKASEGNYDICLTKMLTRGAAHRRMLQAQSKEAVVINWFRSTAIPISGPAPTADLTDLTPFEKALSGVRIVGLGEASHGSREIFQVRHRLMQLLVEKLGYRVLAFELDLVAGRRLDDFVHGRTSAIDANLKPWDTEEIVSMFSWLRDYNAGVAVSEQVTVIGIDGQDRVSGAEQVASYLQRVAPERAAEARTLFEDKTFPTKLPPTRRLALQRQYENLFTFFNLNGARLIAASSRAEYIEMLEIVRAMTETGSIYDDSSAEAQQARRDAYMAENLRRVVDALPSSTKVALWAHNGHVKAVVSTHRFIGGYLRELYGREYYALGSDFFAGQYQSWSSTEPLSLDVVQASAAPVGSAEDTFEKTGLPAFLIDFRSTAPPAEVREWLATPRLQRGPGAQDQKPIYYGPVLPLGAEFDGMVFVRDSSRARPTERMRRKFPSSAGVNAAARRSHGNEV